MGPCYGSLLSLETDNTHTTHTTPFSHQPSRLPTNETNKVALVHCHIVAVRQLATKVTKIALLMAPDLAQWTPLLAPS